MSMSSISATTSRALCWAAASLDAPGTPAAGQEGRRRRAAARRLRRRRRPPSNASARPNESRPCRGRMGPVAQCHAPRMRQCVVRDNPSPHCRRRASGRHPGGGCGFPERRAPVARGRGCSQSLLSGMRESGNRPQKVGRRPSRGRSSTDSGRTLSSTSVRPDRRSFAAPQLAPTAAISATPCR